MKELHVLPLRVEKPIDDGKGCAHIKALATENIQINIIRLFREVSSDIGCLDKLDKGISFLIAGSKHDNARRAEGNHINSLYKLLGKLCNDGL